MKKGNVEVIIHDVNKEGFTGYTFYIKRGFLFHVEDNEYLKDLRSLIDTVLGEDCLHKKPALSKSTRRGTRKICNSCGQDWKKEWDSQPLTEGEDRECTNYVEVKVMGIIQDYCGACNGKVECHLKPQESTKEEESKLDPWRKKYLVGTAEQIKELTRIGATDGIVHKFDEELEEPSKKPSEEIYQRIARNNNFSNSELDVHNFLFTRNNMASYCIIQYLDELHNQGKI